MSSLCYKCANEIDEEKHDYAECDSCDSLFHIEYWRKNLMLEKTANVCSYITRIVLIKRPTWNSLWNFCTNWICSTKTLKLILLLKQKSAETYKAIESNVNKEEVKICSTQNVREGGIVLQCANANETMKVKQIISEKLGDNYEVILPKVKCPRVRISNIDDKIPKDKIIDELKKANESIQNMQMRLITVIPRKRNANSTNDIVIEVDSASFKQLIELGILDLP